MRESTVGAKSFAALPDAARRYLARIEALTGVPIAMVSTGPDRDETILVRHPFSCADESKPLLSSEDISLESPAEPDDSRR